MLTRLLMGSALLFTQGASVASQQQLSLATKAAISTTLAGHYVGAAVSKSGQSIPLSLDATMSQEQYSGAVTTPFGVFALSGRNSLRAPVLLKLSGPSGEGTLTLSSVGEEVTGTYALADDSGMVSLHRTSSQALSAAASKDSLKSLILFLGVYHMANPELDAIPFVADDVLAPKRQDQIRDLVYRLNQFHPTKVLIEAPPAASEWQELFQKYLHGEAKLGRNEIEQLGFRVAQAANLPGVEGVDYQMYLNGLRPDELQPADTATTSRREYTAPPVLSHEEQTLRSMTVSQYLARINSPAWLAAEQSQYMNMLLPDRQPELYRGADLVANWYKRNLRIMENINRNAKPGDRVLVIIGVGHVPLLREFAQQSSYFTVVDPKPFLVPSSR